MWNGLWRQFMKSKPEGATKKEVLEFASKLAKGFGLIKK
jgi:hypothetical protein